VGLAATAAQARSQSAPEAVAPKETKPRSCPTFLPAPDTLVRSMPNSSPRLIQRKPDGLTPLVSSKRRAEAIFTSFAPQWNRRNNGMDSSTTNSSMATMARHGISMAFKIDVQPFPSRRSSAATAVSTVIERGTDVPNWPTRSKKS